MSHPPYLPPRTPRGPRRLLLSVAILGSVGIAAAGVLATLDPRPPVEEVRPSPSVIPATPLASPSTPSPSPNAIEAPVGARLVAAATDPSRVRVRRFGIDIAVLPGGDPEAPRCQVAEFLPEFGRPGDPTNRSWTFIYAHGRSGMFGPLVAASSAVLRSSVVEIWTGDGRRIDYRVERVITNAESVALLSGIDPTAVILQTCETADGRGPKRYLILREQTTVMDPDGASPVLPDSSC